MKTIIILSDLWGKLNNHWITHYTNLLEGQFEVKYYDVRQLAEIDLNINTQEELHHAFTSGGIKKAVHHLLKTESSAHVLLAFSVGGTIGWRAILQGLNIGQFIAISATRLRYETQPCPVPSLLYFGEFDQYKPKALWFKKMNIDFNIIANQNHEMYRTSLIAKKITGQIL